MKKIYSLTLVLSLFLVTLAHSQVKKSINVNLDWAEEGLSRYVSDGTTETVPYFKDANFSNSESPLPQFHTSLGLKNNSKIEARITNVVYEAIDMDYDFSSIGQENQILLNTYTTKARQKYIGHVEFTPIVYNGIGYEKVVSFDLEISASPKVNTPLRLPPFKSNSILSDGDIYKLRITEGGVHVLTYDFLKSEVGLDVDNINPADIQIYSGGGGILPERNGDERVDDLNAVAMEVSGIQDGSFDNGDRIIFYAEGATVEKYSLNSKTISAPINVYDDFNFYYLKVGDVTQNIMQNVSSIQNTTGSTNEFDYFTKIEEDNINILHEYAFTQGSGSTWYMQKFDGLREQDYEINIPNVVPNSSATVQSAFAGRSDQSSYYEMIINGETFRSQTMSSVRTSDIESSHASRVLFSQDVSLSNDNNTVRIKYLGPAGFASSGWLDFISVNARCNIVLEDNELVFRDFESLQNESTTFNLTSNASETKVWNITDPLNTQNIGLGASTGNISFGASTDRLQTFIAFDNSAVSRSPEFVEKIENQNLHSIENADMVIIYPKEFEEQANDLAAHRRSFSQLDVKTVLLDEILNEFSSGKNDPAAIRDFCRMIYSRDSDFRFVLLIGDGSFDHRGRYSDITIRSNFIPVYEEDSLNPIFAYPMDDFYGLLDEDEGDSVFGGLELAIGRLPVKTVSEAQLVVNKIKDYEASPESMGSWTNDITFVADDEDNNTHINDADGIAEMVRNTYGQYNINKLYADSYVQLSTPGGEKYPDMTEELNKVMFQGALLVNYLGHGGSKGWAQERFLDLTDIAGWTNRNKLPLMVTATCSFTGYDDPAFVTAGERCLLNNNGGVIGLMTTVRAVFASSNERLTRSVFDRVFIKQDGKTPPFGDIMLDGKNAEGNNNENTRKFALIGDPAMRIAIPLHKVQTLSINDNPIDTIVRDTMHALDRVKITGQVTSQSDELLTDFNGKVFVKIFDKVEDIPTLVNDPGARGSLFRTFKSQKNLIFSGVASVTNGLFSIEFVVPKDINYEFGPGKISYYATDEESMDASGFFTGFIVGGANPDGVVDNEPPSVEVFMDNFNFVLGGTTTPDPVLLVRLSDNLGINVAGSSIGHDLTGTLDNNNTQSFALNDFYEAALDDFTSGTVRFPLFDLASGRHEIKVKAWDVANNSAEGFTEFIVAENQTLALEQVLNYPNPFTTNTEFMFEHNLPGQVLDIQVRIFTVSGKMVKSINTQSISDGNRVRNVTWDGKDDFGGDLARGVYLYKIKASPSENTANIEASESEFEKLVILK